MNIEGMLQYMVCKQAQQTSCCCKNAGSTYKEVKGHVGQSVQCSVSNVHYSKVNCS